MTCQTICVWGDSIGKGVYYDEVRGRYAILRDSCARLLERESGFDVRNHSVMGRTAEECLEAIDGEEAVPGALAVFEFGGNDSDMDWAQVAREPDREHAPRCPLVSFRRALGGLVDWARARGMEPVLLTPVPLEGEKYFRWVSRGLDAGAILHYLGGETHMMYRWQEQYAGAVWQTAREKDAKLVDVRGALLADRGFGQYYCLDGIHLNARGHEKLYRWLTQG